MLVDFDILKFVRLDLNPGNRQKYGKIKKKLIFCHFLFIFKDESLSCDDFARCCLTVLRRS